MQDDAPVRAGRIVPVVRARGINSTWRWFPRVAAVWIVAPCLTLVSETASTGQQQSVVTGAPASDEALENLRIGSIDLYGLETVPEQTVRAALGVQVGDRVPGSDDLARLKARLKAIPGVGDADVDRVCCEDRNAELFVGIRESAGNALVFHKAPQDNIALPREIRDASREFGDALRDAVLRGDAVDDLSQSAGMAARGLAKGP